MVHGDPFVRAAVPETHMTIPCCACRSPNQMAFHSDRIGFECHACHERQYIYQKVLPPGVQPHQVDLNQLFYSVSMRESADSAPPKPAPDRASVKGARARTRAPGGPSTSAH